MFTFILGREFRLSLAEIQSLFPHAFFEYANEQFALVSDISEEEIRDKFAYIGGTIKVIKILDEVRDVPDFMTVATDYLKRADRTNKVPFAVAGYGEKLDNFATGLRIKKFLKSCEDKSFRLVNKEPKNINSAVYKKERLGESETEVNFVKAGKISYFGVTIAYQDVDVYAARDMDKTRDMGVGMLPPKLAQMMVNLTYSPHPSPLLEGEGIKSAKLPSPPRRRVGDEVKAIYDPFCGLGTILIEAVNMGYGQIFGSDISPEMVQASKKSMENFLGKRDESGSVIVSGAKQSRSNEPFSKAEDSETSSE